MCLETSLISRKIFRMSIQKTPYQTLFELGVGVQNYSVDFVAAIHDHDFGQNPVDIFSDTLILPENCPNTELFLVRNFPHSDWIRRDTEYLSVFSPNAGKIWTRRSSVFGHFSRCVICVEAVLSDNVKSCKCGGETITVINSIMHANNTDNNNFVFISQVNIIIKKVSKFRNWQ